MSQRPSKAANDELCAVTDPSRRRLVVESVAMTNRQIDPVDLAIDTCEAWLANFAEDRKLIGRWQTLESCMISACREQPNEFPEAMEMVEIENRLDALQVERQTIMGVLLQIPATTSRGLALKLAIAAATVPRDENKDAHDLLEGAVSDLLKLSGIKLNIPAV